MESDEAQRIPALVAVNVPNMGRMAIHRSEAQQIIGGQPSASLSDNTSSTSGSSSIGNSSQTSASTSLTQHSMQLSDDCDEQIDVASPSFTVMSSFPSSQHTTPAKASIAWFANQFSSDAQQKAGLGSTASARDDTLAALFKSSAAGLTGEKRMQAIRAALPMVKKHIASSDSLQSYKPKLPGSGMPSLDWPDSPEGPWNATGREVARKQVKRTQSIAQWLENESSDDDEPAIDLGGTTPRASTSDGLQAYRNQMLSGPQDQHPMIAKAIHDRKRKDLTNLAQVRLHQRTQALNRQALAPQHKRPRVGSRQSSNAVSKSRRKALIASGAVAAMTPSERRAEQRQLRKRQKISSAKKPRSTLDAGYAGYSAAVPPPPFSESPYAANRQGYLSIGCRCGHGENGAPMLRCDSCSLWYHSTCVGIPDPARFSGDWLCMICSGSEMDTMSPHSVADSTAASLMVTPNFPRSAALEGHALRLSQGELPVFCHPSETPFRRPEGHAHHGFSSALALAPSPVMLTADEMAHRNAQGHAAATATAQAGRARAARVGWHMHEPASPLDRKSSHFGHHSGHHRNISSGASHALGMSSEFDGATSSSVSLYPESSASLLRTPSPRMASTPKRQRLPSAGGFGRVLPGSAQNGQWHATSSMGPSSLRRRESSAVRDFDDVFSTPSRMLHGSSWEHGHTLRHAREESMSSATGTAAHSHGSAHRSVAGPHGTPWGLSTPTRGFVDSTGIFSSSDYSGAADGLPSLVHSSSGMDLGDFASWQHLQGSPTSSTRAGARAALSNANKGTFYNGGGRRTSSMREGTPDGLLYSADPSSSPFPRTPTFGSELYGGMSGTGLGASRRLSSMSHSLLQSPSATPTRKNGVPRHQRNASTTSNSGTLEALGGPLELHSERRPSTLQNSKQQQHAHASFGSRGRKVSADVMAGLGIGLDLNDVLDWQ